MKETKIKKIISIGDIHGRDKWKRIPMSNADKVIFHGDYFDSFSVPFEEQIKNFKEILSFQKNNPKKVILLLGNHDYHYLYGVNERYSGFQALNDEKISKIVSSSVDKGLIKPCYGYGNFIFTHAGITNTWYVENCGDRVDICDAINEKFKSNPEAFKFNGHDSTGDNKTQGPLWVRPFSLLLDRIDNVIQIVGHTIQNNIEINSKVIFIDTLEYGKEYLIINNGVPEVGKIT